MRINYQDWNAARKVIQEFTADPQYTTASIDIQVWLDHITIHAFIFDGPKCHMSVEDSREDALPKRVRDAIAEVRVKAGLDKADGSDN